MKINATRISYIFLLFMESKTLVKSKSRCVAPRFIARINLMIQCMLNLRVCGAIHSKAVLIFLKNFLVFKLDTFKKNGFLKLNTSY